MDLNPKKSTVWVVWPPGTACGRVNGGESARGPFLKAR